MPFPNKTLAKVSPERRREIGSMGGKVKSYKKKHAARLRAMKQQKGLTERDIDWFVERMIDPDANLLEISKSLESVKPFLDPEKYISLSERMHRTIHGERKIDNTQNLQVNIITNADVDDILDRLEG